MHGEIARHIKTACCAPNEIEGDTDMDEIVWQIWDYRISSDKNKYSSSGRVYTLQHRYGYWQYVDNFETLDDAIAAYEKIRGLVPAKLGKTEHRKSDTTRAES